MTEKDRVKGGVAVASGSEEIVHIYSDGACKGNPGPGGYGTILVYKGAEKELSGGEARMTKGWAKSWQAKGWVKSDKKPALNPDLWEELLRLTAVHRVEFHWIKGHAGHPYNERCDRLAVAQAERFLKKGDGSER